MMIDTVWIAFLCGMVIGSCLGILILGFVSINRDTRLRDTIRKYKKNSPKKV